MKKKSKKTSVKSGKAEKKSGINSEEIRVPRTKIKVIGIGGGGNSIVSEISRDKRFKGIDFIALNTDVQALKKLSGRCRIVRIGENVTEGLGCGMDSKLGEKAARQDAEKIKKVLREADFCILISCLGGGMGSGGTPVVAEICKSLKKCSLGIFTLPFSFEGNKKKAVARNSLKKMKGNLNGLNIIQNEKIFKTIDKSTPLKNAFSSVNQDLAFKLAGLIEMIYKPGLINIDWADFRTILEGKGKLCYLNRSEFFGEERAMASAKESVQSPLNDYSLRKADRILFNIEGGKNLKMAEVEQISRFISNFNRKAKIIFGISLANPKTNGLRITLLAMERDPEKKAIGEIQEEEEPKEILLSEESPEKKEKKSPLAEKEKVKKEKKDLKKKRASEKKAPSKKKKRPSKKQKLPKDRGSKAKRKNALTLKKETEKEERKILEEEKKWELPAFLRKKQYE
jgi:cell division protein FtsZ